MRFLQSSLTLNSPRTKVLHPSQSQRSGVFPVHPVWKTDMQLLSDYHPGQRETTRYGCGRKGRNHSDPKGRTGVLRDEQTSINMEFRVLEVLASKINSNGEM